MPFGLQQAQGDQLLTLTGAGVGTTTSGPIAGAGQVAYVLLLVHCTVITGTSPTLTVNLESSPSGTGSWTAVGGSSTVALAAAGSAVTFAVANNNYIRASAVVGGTTPAVTATIAAIVFGE